MIHSSDSSVTFDRSELVYLLKKNKISNIIGLDMDVITHGKEYADFCRFGKNLYSASQITKETRARINSIMKSLRELQYGIVLIKRTKNIGEQLYIYNFSSNDCVEHIQPENGKHRFVLYQNETEFITRLSSVIPIIPIGNDNLMQFYIPEDKFSDLIDHLRQSDQESSSETKTTYIIPEDYKKPFFEAIRNPEFSISMLAIIISKNVSVEIDSYAVFASNNSVWGVSKEKDKPELTIYPAGIDDVYNWIIQKKNSDFGKD